MSGSGFSRDCLCRDYPGTISPEMNDWRSRLLAAVSPLESGVRGLQVSGFRPPDSEAHRPSRTAAVLVAILDLPEPELVLTRRADHLPQHPGQVCFPGGAAEDNDRSAVQTALREAQEEIGLVVGHGAALSRFGWDGPCTLVPCTLLDVRQE